MKLIPITDSNLRFMGRIDDAHAGFQVWAFPYVQVSFRCTGTHVGIRLVNHWGYGGAYIGAIIDGVQSLHGCEVRACDLRAGAAMVIAGLCAQGVTELSQVQFIERGYEDIIGKLCALGADIRRVETFEPIGAGESAG